MVDDDPDPDDQFADKPQQDYLKPGAQSLCKNTFSENYIHSLSLIVRTYDIFI